MSHYEDVLNEAKEKREKLAAQYIPELYYILRDEEKLPPEDCRARIEHDCLDLWSRATIRKYLPDEAKDFKKQAAGKVGAENKKKALLLVAQTENGARTTLAEDDSINQKEEESRSFHKEFDRGLASRTIPPALYEARRIIEEKDRKIEEKDRKIEELNESRLQTSSSLFLANNLTLLIRQFPTSDFILNHNGYEVTSVQPASKDEMSAAADARLSQTGTSWTS